MTPKLTFRQGLLQVVHQLGQLLELPGGWGEGDQLKTWESEAKEKKKNNLLHSVLIFLLLLLLLLLSSLLFIWQH